MSRTSPAHGVPALDALDGTLSTLQAAILRHPVAAQALYAALVRQGRAAAMVTAGNTGAAWIAAKSTLGMIEGVDRPALAAILPKLEGQRQPVVFQIPAIEGSSDPAAHGYQALLTPLLDAQGNVVRLPELTGHRVSFVSQVTPPESTPRSFPAASSARAITLESTLL